MESESSKLSIASAARNTAKRHKWPANTPNTSAFGIKITPSSILFDNAYEGKRFSDSIEIQNISSESILIRFGKPTSSSLKLISSQKEYILCTGFKCGCKLEYTYNSLTSIPIIYFPIFINQNTIDYEVKVSRNFAQLVCVPSELNFGTLNVRETSYFTVILENIGTKNTNFALDLGQNFIGIVIVPMRGVVPAKSQVSLQLIFLGEREEEHDTEIWIKCNIPQKLRIFGTFVIPRLITSNVVTCNYFTLIEFPRLYYGQQETKILVVENSGSTICMFCSEILVDGKMQFFSKYRKSHPHFKWISINPSESRLEPHQKITMQFVLKPLKTNIHSSSTNIAEFVRLRRITWKDLDYEVEEEEESTDFIPVCATKAMSKSSVASAMMTYGSINDDVNLTDDIEYSEATINDSLNVCLYSEVSVPKVTAIPQEDYCKQSFLVNNVNEFKITIRNDSSVLPIQVLFKKVCHINIEPTKLNLHANESKSAKIFITPVVPGKISHEIDMDLYNKGFMVGKKSFSIQFVAVTSSPTKKTLLPRFNMGLTPHTLNEVGFNVNDVRFNSDVEMPRNAIACLSKKKLKKVGNFLVAFPNDRPKTLYLERLPTKSLTIFANLPRIAEVKHKESGNSYYNNYKKNISKTIEIHNIPKIKQQRIGCTNSLAKHNLKTKSISLPPLVRPTIYKKQLLSLTPIELANIVISPQRVVLRKVAPNTDVISIITVHNKNDFDISVRLQSLKTEISFATEGNTIIKENSIKELEISYNSFIIGRNIAPLQVVVNNAHVFELNVIAMVVPKEVNLNREFIDIDPYDRTTEFIELKNPLNSPVLFSWELNSHCFAVYPTFGIIPPERNLLCHIQYNQIPKSSDSTVILLKSEGGNEKHMKLTYMSKTKTVAVDVKVIDFIDIPINIPRYKTFIIKNLTQVAASFYLNNPYIIHGLSVTPTQGVIPRKGIQKFVVKALISVPISFSRIISIHVERCRDVDIEVKCLVNFPMLDIQPNFLKIKNVVPDATVTLTFQLKNLDNIDMEVAFDFRDYPEFCVSVNGNKSNSSNNYILRRKETKTFYLHCSPKEATVFALFLPIIINNVIGPLILNNPKSRNADFFFADNLKKYENISSIVIQPTPKILNSCKITTIVSIPHLKFSNFTIKLKYHHHLEYKLQNMGTFEVHNISNDKTVDFCIRTDSLTSPFDFQYIEGKIVEVNPNSLFCSLNAEEYTIFSVRFQPEIMKFGSYQRELPLYVRDTFDCSPYNTIILQGTYNKPTIKCLDNKKVIYFQPSCTMLAHEQPLELEVNYHSNKCMINSFCSRPELQVVFQDGRRIQVGLNIIKVLLKVIARRAMKIEDKITFGCSCGPFKLDVFVKGCWENCIPTAYSMFYISNYPIPIEDDLTSIRTQTSGTLALISDTYSSTAISSNITLQNQKDYPLFPDDTDESDYANYMREVFNNVESWLNCQGFYNSTNYVVPDNLNVFNNNVPPLARLLVNFGGIEVKNYLGVYTKSFDISPSNIFTTYQRCLDLISAQGGFLAHVKPEFLMDYENYESFLSKSIRSEPTLERDVFYRRSKQCWLDVILQIYKVFVLSHIENPPAEAKNAAVVSHKLFLTNSKTLKKVVSARISDATSENYSMAECILLKWAEMHYEKQHSKLWVLPSHQKHKRREFQLFDKDFTDSLCFATILYSYCPFLKNSLSDMYYNPQEEIFELYHNANIFCYVWYKLKLSFEIKPQQIVKPNIVQMLMLLNYMYEILPNFYPSDTVTIDAPLTQTIEHTILIENHDNRNVTYNVMFFGDHSEYFETAQTILHVIPRTPSKLLIKFFAKKMETCLATLVLCGEVPGDKYATSLTMNLVGIVHSTEVFEVSNIEKNVYEIYKEKVKLTKITPGVYDLFYSTEDGYSAFTDPDITDIPPITTIHKQVTIDSTGEGYEYIDGLLTTVNKTTMFVFGRNQEIGDFAQKITFSGKYSNKVVEKLWEILPENFELIKCSCSSSDKPSNFCNRTRYIKVPMRNNVLWKSLVNFIVKKTEGHTAPIIKNILSSSIGTEVLKGYSDFKQDTTLKDLIFLDNIKYLVRFPKNCGIAPPTIFFQNVYQNGHIELPVHLNIDYDVTKPIKFRLDSDSNNSHDSRFYLLTFKS